MLLTNISKNNDPDKLKQLILARMKNKSDLSQVKQTSLTPVLNQSNKASNLFDKQSNKSMY